MGTDPEDCILTGGTEIEYVVDALGRRIGKRVNGALQKGFLWSDGLRVVAELDGTGAVVSRFVHGNRPNVPEYVVKGGVSYRIVTDHLGSVRLVVNTADPNPLTAVVQRIDYDAFGVVTADTSPGFQPFGFAGGLYDPDTGLVRFGARDYDARTARWNTKDPIRFDAGDTSLFGYALGDPINFLDINGLWVVKGGFSGTGVVGAGGTGSVGLWAGRDSNRNGFDAGGFGEVGSATGFDASVTAFVGFSGSVEGESRGLSYSLGPFSATVELSCGDNSWTGFTLGFGAKGTPVGATNSNTTSGSVSFGDLFGALGF